MSIVEEIQKAKSEFAERLDQIVADHAETAPTASGESPEVRQAAEQLGRAVAREVSGGRDVQVAEGGGPTVIPLSPEMLAGLGKLGESGGVAVAVFTAEPQG
jgi:hypothetical protein